ncbi:hypothetical protein [Mammaliicoccus stepanovicii]|uniref:Uncharacterized protein n=1 Tax=Mammaliicoccus stepanovicii TaxID=643214 RepID=A0A239ZXG4_9STAP|nr:hypothetical protein [Mammaliicoccus stepanovicii]GGI39195.1 hypothetical protein GCM10010896_02170 [Mammaliicoccus stepanovicii]SNV75697.1 Uncharacterised protein [Mammaliicoccus stepanovicii]
MKRVQMMIVLLGCILLLVGLVTHQAVGVSFLVIGVLLIMFGVIKETTKK